MTRRIPNKFSVPLLVTVLLFILIFSAGIKIPETTIKNTIESAGSFGIFVFIFLVWITYFFAPLGATPFTFAGFYLYGPIVVFYMAAATILASITNFWVARILGRKIVIRLTGQEGLKKVDNFTTNYGLKTLLFLRILLVGFHDVISYAFGLTSIRFIPYFIISVLGLIPNTIFWYYLSSKLNDPFTFTVLTMLIAYVLLATFLISRKFLRKRI